MPNIRLLLSHPANFFALGFGSGLAKKAPGTFGTLVGLPLFWLISSYPMAIQISIISVLFAIGIYFCTFTGKAIGVVDHGSIVWDEIVGFSVTMLAAPPNWYWLVTGFVLFRLFDIWKPWPIREADHRLQGGFGIMLDDVIAGAFAAALLLVLIYVVKT